MRTDLTHGLERRQFGSAALLVDQTERAERPRHPEQRQHGQHAGQPRPVLLLTTCNRQVTPTYKTTQNNHSAVTYYFTYAN